MNTRSNVHLFSGILLVVSVHIMLQLTNACLFVDICWIRSSTVAAE